MRPYSSSLAYEVRTNPSRTELRKPLVVGLCGAAGAGKDTFAEGIRKYCDDNNLRYRHVAFADALREMAYDLFKGAVPRKKFWDRETKETKLPELSDTLSPREILQRLGVSARQHINDKVWIYAVHNKLIEWHNEDERNPGIAVVSDVRFPNEVHWLQNLSFPWGALNGVLIRVLRDNAKPIGKHETEDYWPSFEVDMEYTNRECEEVADAHTFAAVAFEGYLKKQV